MKYFTIAELTKTDHKGIDNTPDATVKKNLTALVITYWTRCGRHTDGLSM